MLTVPFSLFTSSPKRYQKLSSFICTTGSVNMLALSTDGQILAAGGTKGIQLWNLVTRKGLAPVAHLDARGIVSCATWMKSRQAASETLCYGTSMGYIVFLQSNYMDNQFQDIYAQRLGKGAEITCIAWDAVSSDAACQIVVGTLDYMVQVLTFSSASRLQSVFAGRFDATIPRSVAFGEPGTFYLFGSYDGVVVKASSKNGTVITEHRCGSVIGCAAVNIKRGFFVVENGTDGFTLYRLETGQAIRTFMIGPASVQVSKQVAFGEEGKVVIGGSDNGCAYVFNRRTGEMIEMLHHMSTTLVQTIAVRDVNGQCIVACASPAVGRRWPMISIWKHAYDARKASTSSQYIQLSRGFAVLAVVVPLLLLAMWSCLSTTKCSELYEWTLTGIPAMTWPQVLPVDVTGLYRFSPAPLSHPDVASQDSEARRETAQREEALQQEALREEAAQEQDMRELVLREIALEVFNLIATEHEFSEPLRPFTDEPAEGQAGGQAEGQAEEPGPTIIFL